MSVERQFGMLGPPLWKRLIRGRALLHIPCVPILPSQTFFEAMDVSMPIAPLSGVSLGRSQVSSHFSSICLASVLQCVGPFAACIYERTAFG